MALFSAVLLGVYDVAKKHALKKNDLWWILLISTGLSSIFLAPFLTAGEPMQHLRLMLKAVLVTASWISGMIALKLLPITTVSTFKTSRPVFVVLFSIILFGERLSLWQWAGVIVVFTAIWLLALSSNKEGISFRGNKGVIAMIIAVFTGVASALWDKVILMDMHPFFVQGWTNIYITAILGVVVLTRSLAARKNPSRALQPLRWDWTILLIAVFITGADMLYFFSLHADGALLSVISLIRRSSVIVTFALGAALFKEKNIAAKSAILALMLAGVVLLMASSL
ncbi:MAG: DMT family transporter [Bacteroidales bacterium]|nr:DMT family transporter [Bacteroidales bacterium]